MDNAHRFMQAATEEAQKGLNEGGIPIGAVLVRESANFAGAEVVNLSLPERVWMMAAYIEIHPDIRNEDIGTL